MAHPAPATHSTPLLRAVPAARAAAAGDGERHGASGGGVRKDAGAMQMIGGVPLAREVSLETIRALISETPEAGLSDGEVLLRRERYGFNELPEKVVNPFLRFLSYFWGPMPIMIWCAAASFWG